MQISFALLDFLIALLMLGTYHVFWLLINLGVSYMVIVFIILFPACNKKYNYIKSATPL